MGVRYLKGQGDFVRRLMEKKMEATLLFWV